MAGISKAEREKRADLAVLVAAGDELDSAALVLGMFRPKDATDASFRGYVMAGLSQRRLDAQRRMEPLADATINRAGKVIAKPIDRDLLHALCAALPFSGKPNGQGVISFEDRLADAKVKARLILEASCES